MDIENCGWFFEYSLVKRVADQYGMKITMYRQPLTIAPLRAARPIAPRIARGVPAAIPHASATIITDIVDRISRVTR